MITIEDKINDGVGLAPYNFELFHRFNPSLTKEVYNYLRGNKSEWKIICGHEVRVLYSNHFLEAISELVIPNKDVYKNRYSSEYYLNPENWSWMN